MWTTGHIQKNFGVTPQTVRNWTKEFSAFLSASATPQVKGSKRSYTADDLTVFALVVQMTAEGVTYEQIRAKLKEGYRGDPPKIETEDLNPISLMSPREIALSMSIMKERDIALGKLEQLLLDRKEDRETVKELNREIGRLEKEVEDLKKRAKKDD